MDRFTKKGQKGIHYFVKPCNPLRLRGDLKRSKIITDNNEL